MKESDVRRSIGQRENAVVPGSAGHHAREIDFVRGVQAANDRRERQGPVEVRCRDRERSVAFEIDGRNDGRQSFAGGYEQIFLERQAGSIRNVDCSVSSHYPVKSEETEQSTLRMLP